MEFFVALLYVILFVAVFWAWGKFDGLKETIRHFEAELENRAEAIHRLTARVYRLEPHEVVEKPLAVERPLSAEAPEPFVLSAFEEPETAKEERVEWETRIGGSWLNKLGVLVLVIGIALFLGYSLTELGPAGRVAIGYAVSVSMLLTGVALERQERFEAYARGLIGGGWAAVYFTTYAVHALPAARLIEDQTIGFVLLCLVSLGILLHSLRYRSEAVTGLAFFVAFFTLTLHPHLAYSVMAAIPLAIALLAIAYRFSWMRMALAGIVLSYGAYAIIFDPKPPEFLGTYPTLWIFWILFEAFDLFDIRKNPGERGVSEFLMPLNCAGLLCVGELCGARFEVFPLAAGVLYAASALARYRGRFEPAATISAALLLWASFARYHGYETNLFQLALAEAIVIAGVMLRSRYLMYLGPAVFAFPVVKVVFFDPASDPRWFQFAWFETALAVVNAWLCRPMAAFPSAATLLITAILYRTLPAAQITPAWAVFGLSLLALDRIVGWKGFRYHGYALALLAFFRMFVNGGSAGDRIIPGAIVILCLYASQYLTPRGEMERPGFSIAATSLLTLLIFREVSGKMLTIAWGFESVALLACGFAARERVLRLSGLALLFGCIGKLFFRDLSTLDTLNRIFSFLVLGLLLLGASWAYTRFREQIQKFL